MSRIAMELNQTACGKPTNRTGTIKTNWNAPERAEIELNATPQG